MIVFTIFVIMITLCHLKKKIKDKSFQVYMFKENEFLQLPKLSNIIHKKFNCVLNVKLLDLCGKQMEFSHNAKLTWVRFVAQHNQSFVHTNYRVCS